jgi:ferrous iron transport protein A
MNDGKLESAQIRPLSTIQAGQTVMFHSVAAGRELKNRLAAMGLVANTKMKVVNNSHPGPFVVSVKDTKIMLGRGMAAKIMVI